MNYELFNEIFCINQQNISFEIESNANAFEFFDYGGFDLCGKNVNCVEVLIVIQFVLKY